jgi:Glycosyl transferase family 2
MGMQELRARVKDRRLLRAGIFLGQNAYRAAESVVAPRRPARAADGTGLYELAAMIRVKDEARFLPEWIAHHVALGVEHVYVYDNNSTDGTGDGLAPFVDAGLATHVAWPPVPASPSAQVDFVDRFGPACRWVAFFDADEFLVEIEPGALAATLAEHADRPAVAVCWRYFGSAGHETVPPGLVTEHFDQADAVYNRHVKVIARPAAIHRPRNSHNFYYRGGRLAVTPDGQRVFASFVTPPTAPRLVLNHYVCRSRADYERKTNRGFVDARSAKDRARRADVVEREVRRHNEVRVPPPATVEATATMLARLGFPAEISGRAPDPVEERT